MRQKPAGATAGAAVLLTALAGAAGLGTASATTTSSGGDYSPGMLAAMERDLGLDASEARDVLSFQERAAGTLEALTTTLGGDYAGAWVDTDDRVLHVAITDRAKAHVVRSFGAEPHHDKHPMWRLDRWMTDLDDAIDPTTAHQYYVDVRNNRIVVDVAHRRMGDVKHAVRDSGVPRGTVAYTQTRQIPELAINVIGGNPYFIDNASRCSVGFPTTGRGFVTAGHCGEVGASTTNPNGSFSVSSFPTNDYAFVQVATGNTLIAAVNTFAGSSRNVAGSTPAAVGAAVCRSGATTGWRCGTLEALNATVNYPEGSVRQLLRATACAEPGDSGGSMVAGNQAQGVTSGGTGDCTAGGTSFYQPVREILSAAGVSLLTRTGTAVRPACSGSVRTLTGTLRAGGEAITAGFAVSRTGFVLGCLDGPAGTNFDLVLQRRTATGTWSRVARAITTSPDEYITAAATAGTYRWVVRAVTGSGAYTLGYTAP